MNAERESFPPIVPCSAQRSGRCAWVAPKSHRREGGSELAGALAGLGAWNPSGCELAPMAGDIYTDWDIEQLEETMRHVVGEDNVADDGL